VTTGWTTRPKTVLVPVPAPTPNPDPPPVVDDDDDDDPAGWTNVVQSTPRQVLRGPPGPPGEPGVQGIDGLPGGRHRKKAKGPLSGSRVVRVTDDGDTVDLASASTLEHMHVVLGISANAVSSGGAEVQVVRKGELEDSTWSWIPFRPVFLSADGRLVQTLDPSWKFVCVVGTALTSTKVLVDVRPVVVLNP
jgi:hypothetical protein